ncbi:SagB/ThcOx family dehydrogenase [bacterium]|nr:SagB/ThcOx family dehydrogenase [bacterium]
MRRTFSFVPFVVAFIVLTGTPAKVKEITHREATPATRVEIEAGAKPSEVLLPEPGKTGPLSLEEAIAKRRSVREFKDDPVRLIELSQLLWAAQGITGEDGFKRAAPSAGAKYPLEIFVVAGRVDGLTSGIYHYEPDSHSLTAVKLGDFREELCGEALGQKWVEEASLSIVIAAVYERTMEKYGERGVRYVHMEVGFVAENIYLQTESLALGTTFVGAFSDGGVKKLLKMDGMEPLGIMPVGVKQQ